MRSSRFQLLVILLLSLNVKAWAAPPNAAQPSVENSLKTAVAEAKAKLGTLEPWQTKIFENDVLLNYQRFIQDFRQTGTQNGTKTSAEVDLQGLRNFLAFYAPKTLGQKNGQETPNILVYLKPQDTCSKCTEGRVAIAKLTRAILERRGFKLDWLNADDVNDDPEQPLSGQVLDQHVFDLAKRKHASAALALQWAQVPPDNMDSAHADEIHYRLQAALRAFSSSEKEWNASQKLELMDNDSFSVFATRALADLFSQLGGETLTTLGKSADSSTMKGDELLVTVTGIKSFSQFGKVKTKIQDALGSGKVEERKMSRAQISLAVLTKKRGEELRMALEGLNLEPGRLSVQSVDEQEIKVEIR